jgi:hypothetical protein
MVATSTRARFCFASVPVGSKELDHAACHDGRRRYRSPIGNSSSVHARRRRDHGIIIIHHNRWLPAAAAACHAQLEWSRLSSNNAIHPSTGPCTHWCTLLDPPLTHHPPFDATPFTHRRQDRQEIKEQRKESRAGHHPCMHHHHFVHANQCKPKAIRSTSRSSQHNWLVGLTY